MSYDIAAKIITQSAELGVNSLKFNWKGESTLNPNFSRLTFMAKHMASGSTFMDRLTNSNFKFNTSRDDIFDGLSNQTKVKVSFDSFDPLVFETQRTGGVHSITLANIDKFYNYPKRIKSDTHLVIQAVRTVKNAQEDIFGEVKRRWPSALVSIRDMVTGRKSGDYSALSYKKIDPRAGRISCNQAHVRVVFNHAGIGYPCCISIKEEYPLGDISRQHLSDIFGGPEAKRLRKQLKDGSAFDYDMCKNCSSFESYKGFKQPWNS